MKENRRWRGSKLSISESRGKKDAGVGDAFASPTALSWFSLAQHKLSVW